jgi:hypothetical protein
MILYIVYRQVKSNFTFPESGMLHLKTVLTPGTISTTVIDAAAKTFKSDTLQLMSPVFRVLSNMNLDSSHSRS